jgi:hypothetical protein
LQRISLEFTVRAIDSIKPKLIGGSPSMGLKIKVIDADPDDILQELFEWFGEDELIKFIKG